MHNAREIKLENYRIGKILCADTKIGQQKGHPFHCQSRKEIVYFNKMILWRSLCSEIIYGSKQYLHKKATNYLVCVCLFSACSSRIVADLLLRGYHHDNMMIQISPRFYFEKKNLRSVYFHS